MRAEVAEEKEPFLDIARTIQNPFELVLSTCPASHLVFWTKPFVTCALVKQASESFKRKVYLLGKRKCTEQ
jgi:hypothetical protein